jgi:MFS family permease
VSVTLAYGALASFIAPFGLEIGLGRGAAAWFWGVYAVVLISVRLVSGRLADRYGYLVSISLGLMLIAVSLCLVTAAHGLVFFVAGAAMFAVGFAFVYPALFAVTIRRVGSESRGTGVGTFTVGFDVGIGLGAVVFGLVAEAVGYRTMFLVAGLAPLTGFALVFLRLRRTRREGRAPVMPTPEGREAALSAAGPPESARLSEADELVHNDGEA